MHFEDLTVWKRAASLSAALYTELNNTREYGYKDQTTRSALSVASNIAEGYERDTAKDRIKFLNYVKGSCAELRTQICIGTKVGLLNPGKDKALARETKGISKMVYGSMQL